MALISQSDIDTFYRDGAVVIRQVLSQDMLNIIDKGIDFNIENPGPRFVDFTKEGTSGKCYKDYWSWPQNAFYQRFFKSSPMAQLVGELMESEEIRFLEDQFFQKAAGANTPSPWHQDQPYYEVAGDFCITWIPLDPVNKANSLEIVAGSHAWGRLFTPANFSDDGQNYFINERQSTLETMIDIDSEIAPENILAWDMEPGDVLVFDSKSVHGNRGNFSKTRSRRATFRWASENCIYDKGVHPWATLIEGHNLAKGEKLQGELFPLLWTKKDGLLHQE